MKKNEVNANENNNNVKENKTMTLQNVMETYQNLTLKRIAEATGTCYQYLLKGSKQPIQGKEYDPKAKNYKEIERRIRRHVQLEDIDFEALNNSIPTKAPAQTIDNFDNNDLFKMRGKEDVFEIIHMTETHIVFQAINDTQPHVMNNSTFLHQSPNVSWLHEKESK